MRTYNHDAGCEKCGQHDIANRFRKRGARIDDHVGSPFIEAEEDLIRRYCRNCGYTWSEKPLKEKSDEHADEDS